MCTYNEMDPFTQWRHMRWLSKRRSRSQIVFPLSWASYHYFNEYHKLFFTLHINMYQGAQIMPQLLVCHNFCFYDFGVFFQNIRTLKIFQHLWFMIYDVCEPMKPMPDKRRDPPQMVLFIPQMAERLSLWPQVHISADRDCANKVPPIAL